MCYNFSHDKRRASLFNMHAVVVIIVIYKSSLDGVLDWGYYVYKEYTKVEEIRYLPISYE